MHTQSVIAVLFYIRKAKSTEGRKAPLFMRVTVNGQRAELSLHRKVSINRWSSTACMVSGTSEEAKTINQYISFWRQQAYEAQEELIRQNAVVSAQAIKNKLLGCSPSGRTLMEAFEFHNHRLKERVGIDHAPGTLCRYEVTMEHVRRFMQKTYHVDDVLLSQLNSRFAADLFHYLITDCRCNNNTSAKYVKNLKRVIRVAMLNDWIQHDPFLGFSPSVRPVDRGFLTMEELEAIEAKPMVSPRLELVRDLFVFSCYTGLAYIDVANLTSENISKGINGSLWISTHRQKTNTPSNIPLLDKAAAIVEKYRNHPAAASSGRLLPVLSNQKLNSYLKEIADVCGISKNLTFHIARHTFATTITLTNGVSIESVSSMLGHTSIKTTQIYAKVVQQKVAQDMEQLAQKLSAKNAKPKSKTL